MLKRAGVAQRQMLGAAVGKIRLFNLQLPFGFLSFRHFPLDFFNETQIGNPPQTKLVAVVLLDFNKWRGAFYGDR